MDHYIPRQEVIIEVDLITGKSYKGKVFIDLDTRVSNYFIGLKDNFFIFIDDDGTARILNVHHIIEIRPIREPHEEDED